jgi:ribosome biogenesis GTPase
MPEGTVVKTTGSWYAVLLENGETLQCRMPGRFKLDGQSLTNPVAVGDKVSVVIDATHEDAMITDIKPRRNYVVRQSPRQKHELHLIASNVDLAMIMATLVQPRLKQGFIDRCLLMTEPHNIPACIVFNKADVYDDEDLALYSGLHDLYAAIGYPVFLCSSLTGEGLDAIRKELKDKVTLLCGQSGVGKSTFINALQPDLDLKVTELSDFSGKGQHTTTFAEMHTLDFGGYIIDMPGIKTLSFNNLEPMDVAHNFREFFALSPECKYQNCTHRTEPSCAVQNAVESGRVSELRYMNYLKILEEIEEQNYWERHKHM